MSPLLLHSNTNQYNINGLLCTYTEMFRIHQELIQSSTTPGPGYRWESNKLTVRHHKREPRGQELL